MTEPATSACPADTPPASTVAVPADATARARARIELWNRTFRSLYGDPTGEVIHEHPDDRDAARLRPPVTRAQLVARPHALRRLLAPLIVTGKLDSRRRDPDFQQLVVAAMRDYRERPSDFREALAALEEYGRSELGVSPDDGAEPEYLDFQRLLAPEELLRIEPARVAQKDGVSTVSRRVRLRMPFLALRNYLDPKNWLDWGPFFEKVGAVEGEHVNRPDGWHGTFEELFVIDWSHFRVSSFHTFLRVDHTFDSDRVRTDYSLLYEADHQFEEDCGFLEARRVPGRLGWCEYYAEKSVRQRNPPGSLLAPMLAAVFLESGLSALELATIRHNAVLTSSPTARAL
jgi:hypothetical protein